jgi:hypothetical protein
MGLVEQIRKHGERVGVKRVAYRDGDRLVYPIAQFPIAVQVILRKMYPDADDVVSRRSSPGDHCHCLGESCGGYPLCFYDRNWSFDGWVERYKNYPNVPGHRHTYNVEE